MNVLLATNNKTKIKRWACLVNKVGHDVDVLQEEEVETNKSSALLNALQKGKYYQMKIGKATVTSSSLIQISGLPRKNQFAVLDGRVVDIDTENRIVPRKKMSYQDAYDLIYSTINGLGGSGFGYLEEALVIVNQNGEASAVTHKIAKTFRIPAGPINKEHSPIDSFIFCDYFNKFETELTEEERDDLEVIIDIFNVLVDVEQKVKTR